MHKSMNARRFDPKTKDIRTMICPVTQLERFYTPQVRFTQAVCTREDA